MPLVHLFQNTSSAHVQIVDAMGSKEEVAVAVVQAAERLFESAVNGGAGAHLDLQEL